MFSKSLIEQGVRPKITHLGISDTEVPHLTPTGSPAVFYNETLICIIVADDKNRMVTLKFRFFCSFVDTLFVIEKI